MQTLDQNDQEVRSHATKVNKQPCVQFNHAYQKEELKSDIKRAFESRNSYSHGTSAHSPLPAIDEHGRQLNPV